MYFFPIFRNRPSAREVLPSFLKKRRPGGGSNVCKKAKLVQTWDRDIVCLPKHMLVPFHTHVGNTGNAWVSSD